MKMSALSLFLLSGFFAVNAHSLTNRNCLMQKTKRLRYLAGLTLLLAVAVTGVRAGQAAADCSSPSGIGRFAWAPPGGTQGTSLACNGASGSSSTNQSAAGAKGMQVNWFTNAPCALGCTMKVEGYAGGSPNPALCTAKVTSSGTTAQKACPSNVTHWKMFINFNLS